MSAPDDRADGPVIQVANEFTVVQLTHVKTGAGERVRIRSPRLGYEVELDALQLESLTWSSKELFSELLDTPYGPGQEMDARPLSDLIPGRGSEWAS